MSTPRSTPRSSVWPALTSAYEGRTPRSRALYQRALDALPGGDTRTGTFFLPYPTFMDRGEGCRLFDVDGNAYFDLLNNFSALVLGHANPDVTHAIARQAERSTAHAAPVESQIALAEALKERLPSLERVRFANSGTEAVMMAIRAARAYTGRPKILKFEGSYHGSYDAARVSVHPHVPPDATPRWPEGDPDEPGLSPGQIGEVLVAPYNDLETTAAIIERHRDELAAVIAEPVMGAAGIIPAERDFLVGLRAVTRSCGVLLILDEIITFRLAWGGAQALYGITPDLTTLGKVIGGGLPVGAFGGAADVMATYDPRRSGTISHSGTYNGNAATMEAGLATLRLLTPAAIAHLETLGDRLRTIMRAALAEYAVPSYVSGVGSLAHVHFTDNPVHDYRSASRADPSAARLLHVALLNRGVFAASRGMFVMSTPMGEAELAAIGAAFRDALSKIAPALERASATTATPSRETAGVGTLS